MARWLFLVLLASGCKQIWGLGDTPGGTIADAPDVGVDVAIPVVDAPLCFGTFGPNAPYCFPTRPSMPLVIAAATPINSDTSPLCSTLFAEECVIAGSTIDVLATVTVTGSRPIVGIATGDIQIHDIGSIDVASHRQNGKHGPGADAKDCQSGEDPATGGGGAGGSFGGNGGDGGASSGRGGKHAATSVPTSLRGGCLGDAGFGAVDGGDGGGALYLIASSITIDGSINASGAAGSGAPAIQRGGGGGGSGGMIVLEAAKITVGTGSQTFIAANGGGGGGGGSQSGGGGAAGTESVGVVGGGGGPANAPAGVGGDSSTIGDPTGITGQAGNNTGGGGGGGGGAGVIKTIGGTITNVLAVSPTPT